MPIFEDLTGNYLDRALHSADSTVLFTTGRRNDAVNEGMQQFVEMTECVIRESTIACSCNTYEYNLLSSAVLGSTGQRGPFAAPGGSALSHLVDDLPVTWTAVRDAGVRGVTRARTIRFAPFVAHAAVPPSQP